MPTHLSERLDQAADRGVPLGGLVLEALRAEHTNMRTEWAPAPADPNDPLPPPRRIMPGGGNKRGVRREILLRNPEVDALVAAATEIGFTPSAYVRAILDRHLPSLPSDPVGNAITERATS